MRCCWTLLVVPVVNRMQRAWSPSRPSYRLLEISSRCFNGWFRIWGIEGLLSGTASARSHVQYISSDFTYAQDSFWEDSHGFSAPGIALDFEKFWAFAWQRPGQKRSACDWADLRSDLRPGYSLFISFESQGLGCFMYRSLLLTAGIPISDSDRLSQAVYHCSYIHICTWVWVVICWFWKVCPGISVRFDWEYGSKPFLFSLSRSSSRVSPSNKWWAQWWYRESAPAKLRFTFCTGCGESWYQPKCTGGSIGAPCLFGVRGNRVASLTPGVRAWKSNLLKPCHNILHRSAPRCLWLSQFS